MLLMELVSLNSSDHEIREVLADKDISPDPHSLHEYG
jgi:hypothetical protein